MQSAKVARGGDTEEQLALMQRDSANLDREFRLIEESYGVDHLDLVLARGYLARLVGSARIVRCLKKRHREIFSEFVEMGNDRRRPPESGQHAVRNFMYSEIASPELQPLSRRHLTNVPTGSI